MAAADEEEPADDCAAASGDGEGEGVVTEELLEPDVLSALTEQSANATSEIGTAPSTSQSGACDATFLISFTQSVSEQTCTVVTSPAMRLFKRAHSGASPSTASNFATSSSSVAVQFAAWTPLDESSTMAAAAKAVTLVIESIVGGGG